MEFHDKLIGLRRAKGLSQEQLANRIDVSRQAVSKWETAESQPDLTKLMLLSNVFEVTLDELCGRETQSAPVLPIAGPKPRRKTAWLCAAALLLGLALGLAGGFSTANVFFPEAPQQQIVPQATQQQIESIAITSLNLDREPGKQIIHVVFSPSVAKDTFEYKVLKTRANGDITSFPAVYNQGVCTCDVPYDLGYDVIYDGFMLRSVIRDGDNEYTSGLAKISYVDEAGFTYEELWNK